MQHQIQEQTWAMQGQYYLQKFQMHQYFLAVDQIHQEMIQTLHRLLHSSHQFDMLQYTMQKRQRREKFSELGGSSYFTLRIPVFTKYSIPITNSSSERISSDHHCALFLIQDGISVEDSVVSTFPTVMIFSLIKNSIP